ncbi:MAG: beta-galactosidase [Bacteroidota bacterium]
MIKILAYALIVIIYASQNSIAQNNLGKYIGEKQLYYGAAYYPETWPENEINKDIERMKELNMNVMRMAEFSWSKMEPEEGKYDFAWLHSIIEKLHNNGIAVILGTPTATPPAWMWEKYPEIARIDDTGLKTIHGARRSCSFTSKIYQKKSVQIVELMAKEFGEKPGVIGWQTDNEFHASADYSEETKVIWHQWLKEKYQSIENLNQLWATALWSQTYQKFEQIPMPLSRIWHHPSLQLEWKRFNTEMVVNFQDLQLEVIRKHSKLPITHDSMPGQYLDYTKLFKDLDYMAVNNYHSFEAYDRIISNYDRMRGYKKGFHWLFETAPNNSGGGKKGNTWFIHQPDGSMKAALMMNYALGGQGTMFWLWRQQRAGHEMPHGSIINAWGKPVANYKDLKNLGAFLNASSDFLMNNPVSPAEIAMVYSHDSDAGLRIEEYTNGLKYYNEWTYRFYLAFHDNYLHRDVISPTDDFTNYKILYIPLLPIVPDLMRSKLKTWVENGGILIAGPMTGYRTKIWTSFTDYALGDLSKWCGIEVDSRIPIGLKRRPAEIPINLNFSEGINWDKVEATIWSEALSSQNGKILATYENGMHHKKAAIIENQIGKGKVIILGTDPGRDIIAKILNKYTKEKNIAPLLNGDKGVVVVPRNGKDEGLVIVNIANETKSLDLGNINYLDIHSTEKITDKLSLKPYESRILKKL